MPCSVLMIVGLDGSGSSLLRRRETHTRRYCRSSRYSGPQTLLSSSVLSMTLPAFAARCWSSIHSVRVSETTSAVLLDQAPVEVDLDVGDTDDVLRADGRPEATAQDGSNAGAQLLRVEGLDEVVVGAHLQAAHLVFVVVLCGEQDDGDAGALTQAAHHFETAHVRHDDVEDDDIGTLLLGDAERFFAIARDDDAEALTGQLELDQTQDAGFVVDGEDQRFDGHTVLFLSGAG